MQRTFALLLLTGILAAAPPEMAVVNGRVWTANPRQPWAEAVSIEAGRIAAVGTNAEVRKTATAATRIVDARGGLVTPGFIDTHTHFLDSGLKLSSVQLRDAATPEEFARRIGAFAKTVPKGTWILGGDWDHELWGGKLPDKSWVDALTPDHPVWVNRLDGHMALANSATLRIAKVTRETRDIAGGTIVRDANGEPTGILKDNAMDPVWPLVPAAPEIVQQRALEAAQRYVTERGVTSAHALGSWDELGVYERGHRAGKLFVRLYGVVPLASWERLRDYVAVKGRGDDVLKIGGLKGFVDGSLGSHTAAFFEPFTDAPKDRGFFVTPSEDLYKWTSGATRAGLHVMVHAIGDRAIRTQLDVYERVIEEQKPKDPRFRIEHAQHIAPCDIPRFAKLGVIPSMQPYHAIDDGRWASRVIGALRSETTYAFRSLLDAGAKLAFGSDWSVAPPTPIEGIYAAVTRRTLDGKQPGGWVPRQKITVEEALAAYTRGAAYASFEEDRKGMLTPGMLADLAVLDRDLTRIAPETIAEAKVVMTIIGGKPVFERK